MHPKLATLISMNKKAINQSTQCAVTTIDFNDDILTVGEEKSAFVEAAKFTRI